MKRFFSFVLAVCLLATLANTASAVVPQTEWYYLPPNATESRYVGPDETGEYLMPDGLYYHPPENYSLFPDDQPNDNWN